MSAAPLSTEELIIAKQGHNSRIICPYCAHQRKKQNIQTLSITAESDRLLYDCHHCGAKGCIPYSRLHNDFKPPLQKAKVVAIPTIFNQDANAVIEFFRQRGVILSDLSVIPPVIAGQKYFHAAQREVPAIGFVYGSKEQPSAIKWRAIERKAFTQDGAASEFYGLGQLDPDADTLVCVEGELDAIALASIGIKAVSVPNGAPSQLSEYRIQAKDDKKFAYLWEAKSLLDRVQKIVLAVDADPPGNALAEEIARRVGRAKCWRPVYPEGCKDLTDVLKLHGETIVRKVLEDAEPLPLQGVYTAKDYSGRLYEVYRHGLSKGLSTGMQDVDDLFTINPGRLTIVTGYPGAGKSELVDQVMVNMAKNNSWKFAIASFENPPYIHIAKLAEKIVGKPFHDGPTPRMTPQELQSAIDFINDHFVFLESKDGDLPTIDSIMDRTKQAVMRLGVRGLVVDPYNYIHRDKTAAEYEWISEMLTRMANFARSHDLHIFFVAHPTKIAPREDGTYMVPKGQQISGSSAWFSKADIGITVHRPAMGGTEIHCWKVRFKWEGKMGACLLDYDLPTGRYFRHVKINHMPPQEQRVHQHWQDGPDDFDLQF
jgi:twinkle protein